MKVPADKAPTTVAEPPTLSDPAVLIDPAVITLVTAAELAVKGPLIEALAAERPVVTDNALAVNEPRTDISPEEMSPVASTVCDVSAPVELRLAAVMRPPAERLPPMFIDPPADTAPDKVMEAASIFPTTLATPAVS